MASSFARRCDDFAKEVGNGPAAALAARRVLEGGRDAANQLVSNLQRAGELVQSFKQVAVDRSHADRRTFDLRESTDQIIASLRPVLKKSQISLTVDVPTGIVMDSYPGLLRPGSDQPVPQQRGARLSRRPPRQHHRRGAPGPRRRVDVFVSDDGVGMTDEIQRRALDPFFTTRRSEGGTGLGLHIIFNLVTQQLGGRLTFESRLGWGTRFRISIPRVCRATRRRCSPQQ